MAQHLHSKKPSVASALRLALVMAALLACSREPPNSGKRLPKLPPTAVAPATFQIGLSLDGAAQAPLTQARLAAIPPDFVQAPRRKLWRFATIAGRPLPAGTVIAVTDTRGVTVEFREGEGVLVPVLAWSQRGEIVALFVDPADPFPAFHGEGGRLGRSPNESPRVSDVQRIAIVTTGAPTGAQGSAGTGSAGALLGSGSASSDATR